MGNNIRRRELVVTAGSPTAAPWTGALLHSDAVTITFDGANLCVGVSSFILVATSLHTPRAALLTCAGPTPIRAVMRMPVILTTPLLRFKSFGVLSDKLEPAPLISILAPDIT